jgi:hypothetical protein
MNSLWWIVALVAALVVLGSLAIPLARRWERQRTCDAVRLFRLRREVLEARFVDLASTLGKPRGLRWLDCEWLPSVTFARDKSTGLITAFVGINVRFEAVEGGDMEEVAAVGTVRDAVALFHFQNGNWGTGGRALFNMNPGDAIARLVSQYDPLPSELTTV